MECIDAAETKPVMRTARQTPDLEPPACLP
jgi:hypothetical protein